MKKSAKRWLWALSVVLLVGFAGLNMLAYNHARAMLRFTRAGARTTNPERLSAWSKMKVLLVGINVPRPFSNMVPSDLDPNCRTFSIVEKNGVTLAAWYCDRGKESPLVILFHGYSAEKTSLMQEARAFLDLGLSVLLVDFRGSGGSSESYTSIGVCEADDVATAVRYAQTNLPHRATILFGQSMGAVAILKAVHEHGLSPDVVILEAVFDTMLHTVRNRFHSMRIPSFPGAEFLVFWGGQQCRFNGFHHNPVEYAQSLDCPSLFMHGTDDPRATVIEGRRVFDAAPGPKEFKTFDKAGHESYIATHESEWRAAVIEILKKSEDKRIQVTGHRHP